MVYKFEHGTIDIIGDSNGYMYYIVNGYKEKRSKILYREFRTRWDNAGQYFIARFLNGASKRIYLNNLTEYR